VWIYRAAAAFHAEQDSWTAGPRASVDIVVRHCVHGMLRETRLLVHEVWWADVNEPYSLAKQFRFWLWGSLYGCIRVSSRARCRLPIACPAASDRTNDITVGTCTALFRRYLFCAGRLLNWNSHLPRQSAVNWQTPRLLRVLANYVSTVKLYTQRRRFGAGFLWHREEFLDSIGEPPRVSIRRRIIRAIADVAANKYDRWYILAHSQGSVIAFNGLMETAYGWPGYLDERRWKRLCRAVLPVQLKTTVNSRVATVPRSCPDAPAGHRRTKSFIASASLGGFTAFLPTGRHWRNSPPFGLLSYPYRASLHSIPTRFG
jgi:hypothetical protein